MMEAIIEHFSSMSPGLLFISLFALSFLENTIPPIPGDTAVVFAAYLVGRSQQHLLGVLCSTTLGSVAGFMAYYLLGRLVPSDYFMRRDFRWFPAKNFQKTEEWFQRYGYWILLANRFLSGVRSFISLVSGLSRLPWPRVLALSLISCAVWNTILIGAGYMLGENWRMIENVLQQYSRVLLVALLLLVVVWFVRKKKRA